MSKTIDLDVLVLFPDGEVSHGMVHELDDDQALEIGAATITALRPLLYGFDFNFKSDDKDEYSLVLAIKEDSGMERDELDDIVESSLVFAAAVASIDL